MLQLRFPTTLGLGLACLAFGCAAPDRSSDVGAGGGAIGGGGSTAGSSSPGGGGTAGSAMPGSGGASGSGNPGMGGGGNEVVISGTGGTTDGGAGAGTGGAGPVACGSSASDPLPYTSGYTPDATLHANAMSTATGLTDAEKQQQMTGLPQSGTPNFNVFNQEDNTTKGIRGFSFRDGPRGVNLDANSDNRADYSTAFPVAIARGAAFDEALEYQIGQAIGDEMLASGNTILLAPTVNILRHPAWGRAQETYGEDVFLLGRLGSAFVVGVQQYAAACAKHYAGNNIENGRETANATMDEQTLREIYTRHFGMIVQEAGVASIMASYNEVNGTHSTQSTHLLGDVLRGDFGFKGFVLSDWWAMPNGNSVPYPQSSTLQPTALEAVSAGLDMELPWRYNYSTLASLVSAGQLQSTQLATAAGRILEQKYRFKVDKTNGPLGLKTPFSTYNTGTSSIANNDQTDPALGLSHVALAQKAAEESMVLLKNASSTLPIDTAKYKRILVLGANVGYQVQSTRSQDACSTSMSNVNCTLDFTTNVRTGDLGSSRVFSDPTKSTGPFAGVQAAAPSGVTVTRSNNAADAAGADFVVVVAGLTPQDEGEEYTGAGDRTTGGTTSSVHTVNFGLDPKGNAGVQNNLITSVAAMGKPMVVVLEGGSIIDMPWLANVPAVVMAWYPGMAGGRALGRLLFGAANFSGKLPITWDTDAGHWPIFANGNGTTQMDYYLGYRYFDHQGAKPQFSFGYGLAYSTFTYANLVVPCSTVNKDGTVSVTVDVSNNGALAGDETVFLFASYPGSPATTRAGNYKELKGFYRVSLSAKGTTGDAKRITIPLRIKDLKRWDTASSSWKIDAGAVKVFLAPSGAAVDTSCANGAGVGCSLSGTFTVN